MWSKFSNDGNHEFGAYSHASLPQPGLRIAVLQYKKIPQIKKQVCYSWKSTFGSALTKHAIY